MFPATTIVDLIRSEKELSQEKAPIKDNREKSIYMTYQDAGSPEQLLSPTSMTPQAVSLAEPDSIMEAKEDKAHMQEMEEAMLLQKMSNEPSVAIEKEKTSCSFLLYLLVFALIVGVVVGAGTDFFVTHSDIEKKYIQKIQTVSKVRSSMEFLRYYSFRLIDSPTEPGIVEHITDYIDIFYRNSKEAVEYLGDPEPVLKTIYHQIEVIQNKKNNVTELAA